MFTLRECKIKVFSSTSRNFSIAPRLSTSRKFLRWQNSSFSIRQPKWASRYDETDNDKASTCWMCILIKISATIFPRLLMKLSKQELNLTTGSHGGGVTSVFEEKCEVKWKIASMHSIVVVCLSCVFIYLHSFRLLFSLSLSLELHLSLFVSVHAHSHGSFTEWSEVNGKSFLCGWSARVGNFVVILNFFEIYFLNF